jgi:site-specific recombinase XerD
VYDRDEVTALLAQIHPPNRRRVGRTVIRNSALVVLLYRTGLRCSEALDLEMRDLRLGRDSPTLFVRCGKLRKSRLVGLSADVVDALARWLEIRADLPGEHVFCTLRGTRLDNGYVREMISRKGREAGIPRAHPHAFRATLAVELVSEGASLPVVRDVLGHANIAYTDAYLRRVFPEQAVDALVNRRV